MKMKMKISEELVDEHQIGARFYFLWPYETMAQSAFAGAALHCIALHAATLNESHILVDRSSCSVWRSKQYQQAPACCG